MAEECPHCGEPLEEDDSLFCKFCAQAKKFISQILEDRL